MAKPDALELSSLVIVERTENVPGNEARPARRSIMATS